MANLEAFLRKKDVESPAAEKTQNSTTTNQKESKPKVVRLTVEQVDQIAAEIFSGNWTYDGLVEKYNVTKSQIYNLIRKIKKFMSTRLEGDEKERVIKKFDEILGRNREKKKSKKKKEELNIIFEKYIEKLKQL